jgi:hypothetical protein
MNDDQPLIDARKEAVKTYIEQTKLLVALSSAFVLAPAGVVAVLKDRAAVGLTPAQLAWFIVADVLFIFSVFMGYVVLGTIAGYQHLNKFDVHRSATRNCSLLQIFSYVVGLIVFMYFSYGLIVSSNPIPLAID